MGQDIITKIGVALVFIGLSAGFYSTGRVVGRAEGKAYCNTELNTLKQTNRNLAHELQQCVIYIKQFFIMGEKNVQAKQDYNSLQ